MKHVNVIRTVPNDKYCYSETECCHYFDNTGGHATCDLNLCGSIEFKNGLYLKPKVCLYLPEA